MFDEADYRAFYKKNTGDVPYEYQVHVAKALIEGRNVVVGAPTGAGKTRAVVMPFLFPGQAYPPSRLVYVLPLRTLAQGIYREAQRLMETCGVRAEEVTIQTGEQPDDPFFQRGRVIVTTFDQLLSGLLDAPYGLSNRLHNINAAVIAGALVVFDEFHLMEPQKAFLTAVAGLRMFRGLCRSAWLSATATRALQDIIREALGADSVPDSEDAGQRMHSVLPSVSLVRRRLAVEAVPLSAQAVLEHYSRRSIALCNTVARAQALFEGLASLIKERRLNVNVILLHSRFFKSDRQRKEEEIRTIFGKERSGEAILVATQVIEAGLDLSCEHLHTEVCPANALVQRAGRCARFPGQEGVVHVYPLPYEAGSHRPYEKRVIEATWEVIADHGGVDLTPPLVAGWVQQVHGPEDEQSLRTGWVPRLEECGRRIQRSAIERKPAQVADLIRETDNVAVILAGSPPDEPMGLELLTPARSTLRGFLYQLPEVAQAGWVWTSDDDRPWKLITGPTDAGTGYLVCLRPEVVAYDEELGLRLGQTGRMESPPRPIPPRPGYRPLVGEVWLDHARNVANEADRRLNTDGLEAGLLGVGLAERFGLAVAGMREIVRAVCLLHDLGKLQDGWQRWAEEAQRARDPGYVHVAPLAHTDFDPSSPGDRAREQGLTNKRPAHAAASAFYAAALLVPMLRTVPAGQLGQLCSASVAAMLGHHGGWLGEGTGIDAGIQPLCLDWPKTVCELLGSDGEKEVRKLERMVDKRGRLEACLKPAVGPDALLEWWPLVAYLVRCLRLADQLATEEGGSDG